jgi:hypothetical protein
VNLTPKHKDLNWLPELFSRQLARSYWPQPVPAALPKGQHWLEDPLGSAGLSQSQATGSAYWDQHPALQAHGRSHLSWSRSNRGSTM